MIAHLFVNTVGVAPTAFLAVISDIVGRLFDMGLMALAQ